MSGVRYDAVRLHDDMAARVLKRYIGDEVAKAVRNMDIEQVVNTAYEQFLKKYKKLYVAKNWMMQKRLKSYSDLLKNTSLNWIKRLLCSLFSVAFYFEICYNIKRGECYGKRNASNRF